MIFYGLTSTLNYTAIHTHQMFVPILRNDREIAEVIFLFSHCTFITRTIYLD